MHVGIEVDYGDEPIRGVIVLKRDVVEGWLPFETFSSVDFGKYNVSFYYDGSLDIYGVTKFDTMTKERTFHRLRIDLAEDKAP